MMYSFTTFKFRIAHAQPVPQCKEFFCHHLNCVLVLVFVGSAKSSVGRASDCSSEGHRFEPSLVDIKTSLTHLVECQCHELKAMGSIPTRGTLCLYQVQEKCCKTILNFDESFCLCETFSCL